MRFSQPVTKNMQKGIREVQKCKKAAAARNAKKEVYENARRQQDT
jgi:hypothetical protein